MKSLSAVFRLRRAQWLCALEYQTVYDWFAKWKQNGLSGRINYRLPQRTRAAAGRDPEPSAAIIDSQSVKTAEVCREVGFDGGKIAKGRKRHIMVDVLGRAVEL